MLQSLSLAQFDELIARNQKLSIIKGICGSLQYRMNDGLVVIEDPDLAFLDSVVLQSLRAVKRVFGVVAL